MIYVTIQCDECSEENADPPSIRSFVRYLRDDGWKINERTGKAVCPECLEGGPA